MSEEKKELKQNTSSSVTSQAKTTSGPDINNTRRSSGARGFQGGRGRGRGRDDKPKDEFEQRILEIARVTRVMAGGKRMNFRACVAIGDKKGSVGVGLGKGADVTIAVNKAVNRAKKEMVNVPLVKGTLPHEIRQKTGAAIILFKPSKQGRGVIAGGVARIILELAGFKNVTAKTLGSKNKINNARCTIAALRALRRDGAKIAGKKDQTGKKEENGQKIENKEENDVSK